MRRRARDPKGIVLNIIPMVDVTFILMIFFIVAGSFDAWEGVLGSRLFRSGGASGLPLPYTPVVVRLTRGAAAGEGVSIKVDSIDKSPATVAELGDLLADLRQRPGFGPEVPVVVFGDDDVAWEHVAGVWNAAVRAGFPHLAIGRNSETRKRGNAETPIGKQP